MVRRRLRLSAESATVRARRARTSRRVKSVRPCCCPMAGFSPPAPRPAAVAHTALYTPGATPAEPGRFAAGPDFAAGDDAGDASAALLPSGHVLIAAVSGRFYEYDGTTLAVTGTLPNDGNTAYFVLPLPNGQVLVTGGVTQVFNGSGSANPAWAPTITAGPPIVTRGSTYTISGTQFNGLSQAAAVGDELERGHQLPAGAHHQYGNGPYRLRAHPRPQHDGRGDRRQPWFPRNSTCRRPRRPAPARWRSSPMASLRCRCP